jgi:hypothetical protein
MSSLSSSSTLPQVEGAYDDNASYAEDSSPAKCKAFLTAARILLRRYPRATANGSTHTQFSIDLVQNAIAAAEQWLESNDTAANPATGPRITRASFEQFREF